MATERERQIAAGADALYEAFPTLAVDLTPGWFTKAAEVVLTASDRVGIHDGIEFVAAPPVAMGRWDSLTRLDIQRFADVLKAHPGRWAVYPWVSTSSAARTTASRITRGQITTFAHGFRAVSRGDKVYVRYEGEK